MLLSDYYLRPIWATWTVRKFFLNGELRQTKIPVNPRTGEFAKVNSPKEWAILPYVKKKYSRIAMLIDDRTDIVGIDIDNCLSNRVMSRHAKDVIDKTQSYTEQSVSGTGLHIIGRTSKYKGFSLKTSQIEIYTLNRYFTVSFNRISHDLTEIKNIDDFLKFYVDMKADSIARATANRSGERDGETYDEEEVLDILNYIPQQIDYNEWVSILMALHSKFGDRGIQIAEQWSPGFPGEVEMKFRSFSSDGVSLGTLIHIAKQYGYKRNPFKDVKKYAFFTQ